MEVKVNNNNNKTNESVKELSDITLELLDRTIAIKNNYKKSLTVGKDGIIYGVIIFEEVIKEINPNEISYGLIDVVKNKIEAYFNFMDYKINEDINAGIYACLVMMGVYITIRMKDVENVFNSEKNNRIVRLRTLD